MNVAGAPGLSLPGLPPGWEFEGWAVIGGVPVTTGRFTDANGPDDGAPFSATTNPAPPFPGEDFLQGAPAGLTFPLDLAGETAVITIEPSPDNDPAPFTLKPLIGAIPAGAVAMTPYDMDNRTTEFPTATVTR